MFLKFHEINKSVLDVIRRVIVHVLKAPWLNGVQFASGRDIHTNQLWVPAHFSLMMEEIS